MILLKPSHVPQDGIEVRIVSAVEMDFKKFNSPETERLVGLTLAELAGIFKLTAENFIAIARQLQSWDYNTWADKSIRIYQEIKTIKESNVLMVRVGEKLKRKKR